MNKPLLLWMATQIITESFPVSSSSHVKLMELLLNKSGNDNFLMQLPHYADDALHVVSLAVLSIFFYQRWMRYVRCLPRTVALVMQNVLYIGISCAVTVVWYGALHGFLGTAWFALPLGLVITMMMLLSLYWCPVTDYRALTWRTALVLGCVQGAALLPGISRLGSTFVTARWLRLSPRHALEYSFAMQVPLIIAAVIRSGMYMAQWPGRADFFTLSTVLVLTGAGVIAYLGLVLVQWLAERHLWWAFGIYMLIPLLSWFLLH